MKNLVRFIKRYSDRDALSFILLLINIARPLERDFAESFKCMKRKLKGRLKFLYEELELSETKFSPLNIRRSLLVEIYKKISIFIHSVNLIKYPLLLAADENFLPTRLRCYLPGRFTLHQEFIQFMPVLTFQLSLVQVCFYLVYKFKSRFDLNLIYFLLQDEKTLRGEISRAQKTDHLLDQGIEYPSNLLQTILFYSVKSRDSVKYKLRPNRTVEMRKKFLKQVVLVFKSAVVITALALIIFAPYSALNAYFDKIYVKIYPGCCPVTERMIHEGKLSNWSVRLDLCDTRKYSFIFDLLENAVFFIDHTVVLVLLVLVTYLVTLDLLEHWQAVDREVRSLLNFLRLYQHRRMKFERSDIARSCAYLNEHHEEHSGQQFAWLSKDRQSKHGLLARQSEGYNQCILELQALIEDFFVCLAKADRFVSLVIRLELVYFLSSNVSFLYFTLRIRDFWQLNLARLILVGVYTGLIFCSVVFTKIKRATDRTYTTLCTLVANDRSIFKAEWVKILANFTDLKRNNFTVMQHTPFISMYTLNMLTTTFSFFVVVETLKRY